MREKKVAQQQWYSLNISQLEFMFGTDRQNGYADGQLDAKRKLYPYNDIYPAADNTERSTGANIVLSVLSVLLAIMLAVDLAVNKDVRDIYGMLLSAADYLFILIAFCFARSMITEAEEYSTPEISVRRNGKTLKISQKSIIPGDIVLLYAGDIVPCDCRLFAADSLRVLEKNVSGGDGVKDADFISHVPGLEPEEQRNMLFAGSIVAQGEAAAVACDTGADTLIVRRGKVKTKKPDSLRLLKHMRRLSTVSSILMTVYVFTLTAVSLVVNGANTLFSVFLLALCLAGTSMCELLCAVAYTVIGCGVYLQSKSAPDFNTGAIIKDISAVEKLAEITCLCVPKTGGICEDRLSAETTYTQNREYSFDAEYIDRTVRLCRFAVASYGGKANRATKQSAPTREQEAILSAAAGLGATVDAVDALMLPIEYRPGRGESPVDCALVLWGRQLTVCVRGSAVHVVRRCTTYFKNGNQYELSEDARGDLIKVASEYEKDTCRVVAVAEKASVYNNLEVGGYCERELCFEGFIVLKEPYSDSCPDTVATLSGMGIKTLMFTEDMSQQSVYLAQRLGICGADDSQVISAPEVSFNASGITDLKMTTYRCFRGLNRAQKKQVITSFEKSGERPGVIGQDLYDIALMDQGRTVGFAANMTLSRQKRRRGAEIGKLRCSGSEALKRAASVIITSADAKGQGGINSALDAILSAKIILNNIYKILLYLLASNVCKALLVAVVTFVPVIKLSAVQLIFSGAIVDLCAVLSIALSKNREEACGKSDLLTDSEKKPGKTVVKGLLAGTAAALLTLIAPVSAVLLGCGDVSALCFAALCPLQLFMAYAAVKGGSRGVNTGHSGMLVMSALALAEYLALSAVFPDFYDKWLTGTLDTPYFACALLPVFIISLIYVTLHLAKQHKK